MKLNKLFVQLCEKRGVTAEFLRPRYERLIAPETLSDMEKAVARIERAIKNQERVLIFGDYDVDGVSASAILYRGLKWAGIVEAEVMLPNRFRDGYGMSRRLVERVKAARQKDKKPISLVITVDCGTNGGEIIEEVVKAGAEVIVTDHHVALGNMPRVAVAVVNPMRDLKKKALLTENLAGAGVAWLVVKALAKRGWIEQEKEKWLLDLAMLGTICDSMKLTGNNRIIAYFGMVVLAKTRWVGLRVMLRKIGRREINTELVEYGIGPRLNAAGRMKSADLALKLLLTERKTEAEALAVELEELNAQRKRQQNQALSEIKIKETERVVVASGAWHEGVVGIIAGELVERYRRPAFALTKIEGGEWKGSGRSFGEFDLAAAVTACQECLVSGGGHAAAAGIKVKQGKLMEFRKKINVYYESLELENQERFLEVEADVEVGDMTDVNLELIEEMERLEPFGEGNPEPVFLIREALVVEAALMGEAQNHLRLVVCKAQKKDIKRHELKLVKFFAGAEREIQAGSFVDVWFRARKNSWQGRTEVEGEILRVEESV